MEIGNMIMNLVAIFVGGVITFFVTRKYYKSAAEDLKREAKELDRLLNLTLRGLANEGIIKLNTNKDGRIEGLIISLSGTISAKSGASGNLTVGKDSKKT